MQYLLIINDLMNRKRNNIILACMVASLGGFLFGFDTAVISGTVGFVEKFYELTKIELGWFTGSALLGCIFGAIGAGKLTDKYGRKPILIISGLLFMLSAIGSALPPNFRMLIVARIVGGIGVGLASVTAPMYISEFAPAKSRGRLVALYQLSIVIGILLAYLSNSQLLNHSESYVGDKGLFSLIFVNDVWRGMFGMETLPAILFVLLICIVPETPRWLICNNKSDKGREVLLRISDESEVDDIIKDIESNAGNKENSSIRELFKPGLRIALIAGICLSVFGQLSGVNIVVYYGPTILEKAGMSLGGALQYQVALGLINLLFTVIAMFVIDRFGRRPLLIGGMSVVAASLLIAGIFFMVNASAILIVSILCIYMAFVALSICSVIWVLTPEIFPNRLRGRAMSIATFSNWLVNTIAASLFPWYVSKCGMSTAFITFAVICAIGVLIFCKLIPETKGKSLEEIEEYWTERGRRV